jgi:hypothetical protein
MVAMFVDYPKRVIKTPALDWPGANGTMAAVKSRLTQTKLLVPIGAGRFVKNKVWAGLDREAQIALGLLMLRMDTMWDAVSRRFRRKK